jgi:hypothetical protein
MSNQMTDKEFIEQVYEIAFGDDAINRDFAREEVLAELSEFSAKALELDEILDNCEYGHPGCMGSHNLEDSLHNHWEDEGWTCVSVGGDLETGEPPFTYTVGLSVPNEKLGMPGFPEIMMIGLDPEKSHLCIGNLINHWKENGIDYGNISGLIRDLDLRITRIDMESTEHIDRFMPIHSFVFRESKGVSVEDMEFVQLIFPNPEGAFIACEHQPFLPTKPYLREV